MNPTDIDSATARGNASLLSISESHIAELLLLFTQNQPTSGTNRQSQSIRQIQDRVNALFELDYDIALVPNSGGEFCQTYPLDLVIMENHKTGPYKAKETSQKTNDAERLKYYFMMSRFSRAHGRFVFPSILCRNKNICRSSTLAIHAEAFINIMHSKAKDVLGLLYHNLVPTRTKSTSALPSPSQSISNGTSTAMSGVSNRVVPDSGFLSMEAQRTADEALLGVLETKYICDLMVETKKKKMGVTLTSSEKVETRYQKFNIDSIPYPGCEFFKFYKDNKHCGLRLMFDWGQSHINTSLNVNVNVPAVRKSASPTNSTSSQTFSIHSSSSASADSAASTASSATSDFPTLVSPSPSTTSAALASISPTVTPSPPPALSSTPLPSVSVSSSSLSSMSCSCKTACHCTTQSVPSLQSSTLPSQATLAPSTIVSVFPHSPAATPLLSADRSGTSSPRPLTPATGRELVPVLSLAAPSTASVPTPSSGSAPMMVPAHNGGKPRTIRTVSVDTDTVSILEDIRSQFTPGVLVSATHADAPSTGFEAFPAGGKLVAPSAATSSVSHRASPVPTSTKALDSAAAAETLPDRAEHEDSDDERRDKFHESDLDEEDGQKQLLLSAAEHGQLVNYCWDLDWTLYRSWDVVELTSNYLMLMMTHIADPEHSSGLLVHCVSGWDRTPLFISLLRLSLWADGEVHSSLDATQILYLTLAYDWLLFCHDLYDRLSKGEDVFYWCFDFLQYITHERFSMKSLDDYRRQQGGDIDETLNIKEQKSKDSRQKPRRKASKSAAPNKSDANPPSLSKSASSSRLSPAKQRLNFNSNTAVGMAIVTDSESSGSLQDLQETARTDAPQQLLAAIEKMNSSVPYDTFSGRTQPTSSLTTSSSTQSNSLQAVKSVSDSITPESTSSSSSSSLFRMDFSYLNGTSQKSQGGTVSSFSNQLHQSHSSNALRDISDPLQQDPSFDSDTAQLLPVANQEEKPLILRAGSATDDEELDDVKRTLGLTASLDLGAQDVPLDSSFTTADANLVMGSPIVEGVYPRPSSQPINIPAPNKAIRSSSGPVPMHSGERPESNRTRPARYVDPMAESITEDPEEHRPDCLYYRAVGAAVATPDTLKPIPHKADIVLLKKDIQACLCRNRMSRSGSWQMISVLSHTPPNPKAQPNTRTNGAKAIGKPNDTPASVAFGTPPSHSSSPSLASPAFSLRSVDSPVSSTPPSIQQTPARDSLGPSSSPFIASPFTPPLQSPAVPLTSFVGTHPAFNLPADTPLSIKDGKVQPRLLLPPPPSIGLPSEPTFANPSFSYDARASRRKDRSLRAQRLLAVRELFFKMYHDNVAKKEAVEPPGDTSRPDASSTNSSGWFRWLM